VPSFYRKPLLLPHTLAAVAVQGKVERFGCCGALTCGKFVNLVHSLGDLVSQICANVPELGKKQSIHPAFSSIFFSALP